MRTALPNLLVSKEEVLQKIQTQIEEGQQLCDRSINSKGELDQVIMESNNWSEYNTDLLIRLFSDPALTGYSSFDSDFLMLGLYWEDDIDEYQTNMARSIGSLKGICKRLDLYGALSETPQSTSGKEVFIVHGHDAAAKHAVARFVAKFDIEPIILDEQASKGQTIITKFEENAEEAGFAIVLLTPDDIGASKDRRNNLKPRARQNVVLELGYFMAKLGRERVCPLLKDEVEKPSDIDGLIYVPMDSSNGWQLKLAAEMKEAGVPIDLNKLAQD